MKLSSMSASFSLQFFFFLLMIIYGSTCDDDLITKTCKATTDGDPNLNFEFCSTALTAAPASECATLRGLGTITIRLTRYNLTDTRCHIKKLLMNKQQPGTPMDSYIKMALEDCFHLYTDAMSSIKDAMKRYRDSRYQDVNVLISSVMDASTTCEDGLTERDGGVSVLKKRNDDSFRLGAIALSVMDMLQNQPSP